MKKLSKTGSIITILAMILTLCAPFSVSAEIGANFTVDFENLTADDTVATSAADLISSTGNKIDVPQVNMTGGTYTIAYDPADSSNKTLHAKTQTAAWQLRLGPKDYITIPNNKVLTARLRIYIVSLSTNHYISISTNHNSSNGMYGVARIYPTYTSTYNGTTQSSTYSNQNNVGRWIDLCYDMYIDSAGNQKYRFYMDGERGSQAVELTPNNTNGTQFVRFVIASSATSGTEYYLDDMGWIEHTLPIPIDAGFKNSAGISSGNINSAPADTT